MKRYLLGLFAPLMVLAPALAEVQPGTGDLIETVGERFTVNIDNYHCDNNLDMAGSFQPTAGIITLCPRGNVTADDHDTVRHEVWHAVQHCITPDNAYFIQPVFEPGTQDWQDYVMSHLPSSLIKAVKKNYPHQMWDTEFEAYATARTLTASEIQNIFIKACIE